METKPPHEAQGDDREAQDTATHAAVIKAVVHDLRIFVSKELAHVKSEVHAELRNAGTAATWAGVCGGVAAVGGVLLGLGAVYLLVHAGLALWVSFMIVGGAALIAATALGAMALARSKQVEPAPRRSSGDAEGDVVDISRWARRAVEREVERARRPARRISATEAE